MAPQSDHYRFDQVGESAWAAIATDAGAADFDHYGGAQVLADVPIVASERTRAAIVEDGPGRISELRETMDAYLAELEERDAPDWERRQGRAIAAEVPGLELAPPTFGEGFRQNIDALRAKAAA